VSATVHGVVEQSFVGLLAVSEGVGEVHVQIDRLGDGLHRVLWLAGTW
jgi:hypothetical protein